MIYFNSIPFPKGVTQQIVETLLRKVALKRTSTLDFKTATINIGSDKMFLGYETKLDLTFTRLKTSFEILLLKLIIIRLSKDPSVRSYDIRVATLPFVASLLFTLRLLGSLADIVNGTADLEDTLGFLLVVGVIAGLYYLEFNIIAS